MKKKMITLLLAGATVAAVFAGCGNKTEDASATPVPTGAVEATETPAPTESTPAGETTVAPTEEAVPTEVPTATETPEAPSAADAIVHLGQYKGLKLYEVDSKVVAEEMHQTMEAFAELTVVNRAAAEGDTVNINYVGKKDGVAFAGGTDDSETGSDLTLGSGMFIPGFEEGLIGATAGEVRDLNLTFPEDYHSAELAGQEVVFTVTVNAVKESVVPELTDAFVAENLGFDTVAEYTMALYQKKNEESFIAQIWDALLTTSTIENYPESLHEYEKKQLVDYYMGMAEYYAPWYGMDTETFLINSFGSMEVFYEMCDAYAKDTVTQNLILTEIATQENLTITEEQYRQSALNLAIQSGYEDVETFEADYGKDELFRDITEVYIIAHVISLSEVVKAESDGNIQQVE